MIEEPQIARVIQTGTKETIIYDIPTSTYNLMLAVFDDWQFFHSRRDKPTVKKVLDLMAAASKLTGLDPWKGVVEKREPTKTELKGLPADSVWEDEFRFYEEGKE